jgi:integrase
MAPHPGAARVFSTKFGKMCRGDNVRYRDEGGEWRTDIEVDHDLRRTWANVAEGLGIDEVQQAAMLNHKRATVTAGYKHRDRNAALWHRLADKIAKAMVARMEPRP